MKREVLTVRIENGWQSKCGRVQATRDIIPASAKLYGTTRRTYWDVALIIDGVTIVEESTDTLDDADLIASWNVELADSGDWQ